MAIRIHQPVFLHQVGRRKNNEDSILPIDNEATANHKLFMVCDGVGGANKGEVASRMVCDLMQQYFNKEIPTIVDAPFLQNALKYIENEMDKYVTQHPECAGMATTLTLLYLDDFNNTATIAWCGDSRVYQVRNGNIIFKTDDHSLVNELLKRGEITAEDARIHPQRNVILRAISGTAYPAELDVVNTLTIKNNDYFLLCSDGILESLDDRIISPLLSDEKTTLPEKQAIINEICLKGSNDNFSMYLLQIAEIVEIKSTTVIDNPIINQPELSSENLEKNPKKINSPQLKNSNKTIYALLAVLTLLLVTGGLVYLFKNPKTSYESYTTQLSKYIIQEKYDSIETLKKQIILQYPEKSENLENFIEEQKIVLKAEKTNQLREKINNWYVNDTLLLKQNLDTLLIKRIPDLPYDTLQQIQKQIDSLNNSKTVNNIDTSK